MFLKFIELQLAE